MVTGVYGIVRLYWWIKGASPDIDGVFFGVLILSIVLGLFLAAISPKEITWDEGKCTILGRIMQSGVYGWNQLEGWSPNAARGMFLIKFANDAAYQIPSIVFPNREWRKFREFLEQNFRDKQRSVWINLKPRE